MPKSKATSTGQTGLVDVDLFSTSASTHGEHIDSATWQWVSNLIEDVNDELHSDAREQRTLEHFNNAWTSWRSLAKYVGSVDLLFHRIGKPEMGMLRLHEVLTASLIALGDMILELGDKLKPQDLSLIGFRKPEFNSMLQNVRESNQDWHVKMNAARLDEIKSAIFGLDGKD